MNKQDRTNTFVLCHFIFLLAAPFTNMECRKRISRLNTKKFSTPSLNKIIVNVRRQKPIRKISRCLQVVQLLAFACDIRGMASRMACADALKYQLLRMFMRHGCNDGGGADIFVTPCIRSIRNAAIATGDINDGHTGLGHIDAYLARRKAAWPDYCVPYLNESCAV
jgi:hypothetical protein